MLAVHVDRSWYERAWLSERAPSRAVQLSLRARLIARHLARAMSAVAARSELLLQQADDRSPSFR
jgi:hypothetical protein